MGRPICYLQAAIAAILLSSSTMGQTAFPDHVEQGETWTDGVHHVVVTQKILSAGDVHEDMVITGTADAEFVSGTSIRLTPDFHAGAFSGNGRFHAHIDPAVGPDGDVVLIAPAPDTAVSGNILHVPKWEKIEIGLQLPQEYQAAIDSFFVHYYADPNDQYVATPGNVDPAHDLNPYADDSLQLVMTLTKPDGTQTLKWGFFMREGKWQGTNNTSLPIEDPNNPLYPYHIRFRLAPDMEGPWQFTLSLKAPFTTTGSGAGLPQALYTGYAFACDPPLPDNHGPLQVNDANRRTLTFEDGTPYFGLGTNLELTGYGNGWWNDPNNYRLVYRNFVNSTGAMRSLHGVGGNFARLFMMNKSLAPENSSLGVYDKFNDPVDCARIIPEQGSGQRNSWVMDMLADTARKYGIQVQLCIVPYPPIIAYEPWAWLNDPYLHQFVAPRDPGTGLYDMKRYFFSNGDPATADDLAGAFYYWKRKYKYVLNRWGYAVHIPIIEPFNEIDQMLTYRPVDMTQPHQDQNCAENNLNWSADPALPATYSQWLTDIIGYVKGEQDLADPVHSALGYSNKLFLTGTGPEDNNNPNWGQPSNPNWNLPNRNPAVDLVDVHHGMYWGEGELSNSFSDSQAIREAYTNSTTDAKRPFHQGESNYYQIKDYDGHHPDYDCAKIFDNYDVSFHNELWAGTFFGNFATMTTWHKERVFWWEHSLPQMYGNNAIPTDFNNMLQTHHSGVLGDYNILKVGPSTYDTVGVQNRTVYHNFKPLSDMLNNSDWQSYDFFNGDFTPQKVYDEANKIECYYLVNQGSLAIGWVHNLNAYWENHYYVTSDAQNFFGCNSPNAQTVELPGFYWDHDFYITWFPTRMNDTIHPADTMVTTSLTGTLTLDMGSAPLGDTLNSYLDTLHTDYAFIISPIPVHRSMVVSNEADTLDSGWDFSLYPNPAHGLLNLLLPDSSSKDIAIYDLSGRQVYGKAQAAGPVVTIPTARLSPGTYCVRVSDAEVARNKLLIIQ